MRAAVYSFLMDFSNGRAWDASQTQILVGQLSYLESIEPTYKDYIIDHYQEKTHCNFHNAVRNILN